MTVYESLVAVRQEVEDFFFQEAWLLDNFRYEEWLELFTDDVRYWAPVRSDVDRGTEDLDNPGLLAHYEENNESLAIRVQRIRTGLAWADEPPARVRHVVSNVRVEGETEAGELSVTSYFMCFKSRLGSERWYVGARQDKLIRLEGRLKIKSRCVLLDHNAIDSITVIF
jgi:3-phenylpropionate/cinnamic acid dioxygenase small subunit